MILVMKKSEIYEAAAAEVLKDWCQGEFGAFEKPEGPVCGMGAICRVAGLTYENYHERAALHDLLVAATGINDFFGNWNDVPGRTKEEVYDKLMEAAKFFRNQGE